MGSTNFGCGWEPTSHKRAYIITQCRSVSASISATRSSVRAEIFLTSKSICPMSRNIAWDSYKIVRDS